jgi:hypothetical protein
MTLANISGDEKHLGMLFSLGHVRFGAIRAGRRPAKTSRLPPVPSIIRALSRLIVKLGQTLQLFFRRAGKFDFASSLVENEAVIGNNHKMSANAEETTDFKHREHDVLVAHDEVIDRPDGLFLSLLTVWPINLLAQ